MDILRIEDYIRPITDDDIYDIEKPTKAEIDRNKKREAIRATLRENYRTRDELVTLVHLAFSEFVKVQYPTNRDIEDIYVHVVMRYNEKGSERVKRSRGR